LATPNLAGVLEQRPGVQVKGQRFNTYCEEELYSIADYEEDGVLALIITFFVRKVKMLAENWWKFLHFAVNWSQCQSE